MAQVQSKPLDAIDADRAEYLRKQEQMFPPPIPYVSKAKRGKVKKTAQTSENKSERKQASIQVQTFKVYYTANEDSPEYEHQIELFNGGSAEDWVIYREDLADTLKRHAVCKSDITLMNLLQATMTGQAQQVLHDIETAQTELNESRGRAEKYDEETLANDIVNSLAQHYFSANGMNWKQAYRSQKRYLRNNLFMGTKDPAKFIDRMIKINNYFQYFPVEDVVKEKKGRTKLPEEELVDIIDATKRLYYAAEDLSRGFNSADLVTIAQMKNHFQQLYTSEKAMASLTKTMPKNDDDDSTSKKKKSNKSKGKNKNGTKPYNKKKKCKHCGLPHDSESCWELPENANDRPANYVPGKYKNGKKDKQNSYASQQKWQQEYNTKLETIMTMMQEKAAPRKKKRKIKQICSDDSSEDDVVRKNMFDCMSVTSVGSENSHNSLNPFPVNMSHEDLDRLSDDEMEKLLQQENDNYSSMIDKDKDEYSETSDMIYYTANPIRNSVAQRAPKRHKSVHYTADIVVEIEDRDGHRVPIRALLDTGTTATLLLKQYVRRGRVSSKKSKIVKWTTLGGHFKTTRESLVDFKFPELNTAKTVTYSCHVDETTKTSTANYDMIIGMDLMTEIGIVVDTSDRTIKWEGNEIPLKLKDVIQDKGNRELIFSMTQDPEILANAEQRYADILDAADNQYYAEDINANVDGIDHLTSEQKDQLKTVLNKHTTLFSGGLGKLNIEPIHLELRDDVKPYHARPFPVPQSLEKHTKDEIKRLRDLEVFEKNKESEWAAPTFVQPKKTGGIRILTDFRKLNECIKRKPFPLPKISDILQKLSGFKYATAIDLSMGYYHIPLDKASQRLCTTILPWGKYRYTRLPMGLCNSPDIFQSIMMDLLGDLDFARAYIDDVLIVSNSYEEHLEQIKAVLSRLEKAGFRARVKKCFFARTELEYLGYWLTREGIQPQPKKVEAILRLTAPRTKRQLRHFLGMVNFYRDMWRRRSHLIAPLTELTKKDVPYIWTKEHQKAFEELRQVISKETLLAFPDFNKEFHVYTDASNTQLGAVIMQDNKPLAFYSRKMTNTQKRYTTGEQELLSIVETLKEFKNILFGQKLIVHTDHKNIVYGNLSNDRLIRWRLLLEEFGAEFRHVAGIDNTVADALSRLEADFDKKTKLDTNIHMQAFAMSMTLTNLTRDESVEIPTTKDTLAEYFFNIQEIESTTFPMSPPLIALEQRKDKQLQSLVQKKSNEFSTKVVENETLITRQGKILVPTVLQPRIIEWVHTYLRHPGSTRMEATIRQTLTWKGMRQQIETHVKKCPLCQLNKKPRKKYGKLPTKEVEPAIPWNRVNVDMIGPLTVKTPKGKFYLRALTMIDPATSWFEIKDVDVINSELCMEAFDDVWLSRYPRPEYIGYDNGSEFKKMFAQLVTNYGLKPKPSTSYNPQSNGIIERIHQVLNDALRTFELEKRELNAKDPWTPFLSAAAYAIRSTYHTTLKATPAQLVFGRDMLLPIQFNADWTAIQLQRQKEMQRNNAQENLQRVPHEYHVGQKILLTLPGIRRKMSTPRTGPHVIEHVYTNGTVRIKRGAISERINIRRITPFIESS